MTTKTTDPAPSQDRNRLSPESPGNEARRRGVLFYMLGYWAVGLAAGLCFKEGGTDAPHRLLYFIVGNALGITSTWFLMKVYARMNVNLAMLITGSVAFVAFQFTLRVLYHATMTAIQWTGILAVLVGMTMATWGKTVEQSQVIPADSDGGKP